VRIGNAAARQLQLDVYGEVILAAQAFTDHGGELDRVEADFLSGLARTICRHWTEPDHGIWEIRAGPRHHTHSKAMCWAGLTALGTLADQGRIRLGLPRERLERERRAIREAIEEQGFDRSLGSYVATFGATDMDATLLLLGINGYADPRGERMLGTLRRVRERLEVNELLYRYDYQDGVGGEEGAFGLCSFWETQLFALQGRLDEARADFDHIASFANDVGLFAEQIDPHTGEALGNFPQAFTHIGLINAAAAIATAEGRAPERRAAPPRSTRAQPGPDGDARRDGAVARAGATAAGAR
jgi:GH15 family glucan-1,4-alpha-glucosidase